MIRSAIRCGSDQMELFRNCVPVCAAVALPPKTKLAMSNGGPTGVKIVAALTIPKTPDTIPALLLPIPTLFFRMVEFCSTVQMSFKWTAVMKRNNNIVRSYNSIILSIA